MKNNIVPAVELRGTILVCQRGSVIFEQSYGYADLSNQVPNDSHTKYATASAGKVFVAVGILQLVEHGKLKLDDTIGTLLELDWRQIDPSVTVEELLSHTSGVPDYFDESVMEEYEELWTDYPNYKIRSNSDLLPLFIDRPMMYEHGTRFQYNNTGFVLLAMVIEALTGTEFDVYLDRNVFSPCGMADTGYYELDRLPAKCAANYIYDESHGNYRTNIYSVDAKGTGAGGAFTTVYDIKVFWEHLLSGSLLNMAAVKEMMTDHSGGTQGYGLGIWLRQCKESVIPFFQGSDPGVSFITSYDRERELMIVVVSNYGDNVWKVLRQITKEIITEQAD